MAFYRLCDQEKKSLEDILKCRQLKLEKGFKIQQLAKGNSNKVPEIIVCAHSSITRIGSCTRDTEMFTLVIDKETQTGGNCPSRDKLNRKKNASLDNDKQVDGIGYKVISD